MPQKRRKPIQRNRPAGQDHRPQPVHSKPDPLRAAKPSPSREPLPAAEPSRSDQPSDRFLTVAEIADRLGFTDQAIRKWGRENKLPLRKLFGSMGPLGMAESQLTAIITGHGPGAEHGQPTA